MSHDCVLRKIGQSRAACMLNAAEVQLTIPIRECLFTGKQRPDFLHPKHQGKTVDGIVVVHLGSRMLILKKTHCKLKSGLLPTLSTHKFRARQPARPCLMDLEHSLSPLLCFQVHSFRRRPVLAFLRGRTRGQSRLRLLDILHSHLLNQTGPDRKACRGCQSSVVMQQCLIRRHSLLQYFNSSSSSISWWLQLFYFLRTRLLPVAKC